jgi:hypothetical protein
MPAEVKLVVDGAAIEALRAPPNGMIFNYMVKTGDRIIAVASSKVRRHTYGPGGTSLADSIVKRFVETDAGLSVIIAAMKPYAYWVHEGNGPPGGRIYPKKPGGVLAFNPTGGATIFRKWVRTSKPNRFLKEAMEEVIGVDDV